MARDITFFWGCTILAKYPFMELSTRTVLREFGINIVDLDGYTCCPEKTLVHNFDEKLWLAAASRNVAVANRANLPMVLNCNGCYSVLQSASSKLKTYKKLREEINTVITQTGITFKGNTSIYHIIEFIYNEITLSLLKTKLKKTMRGMNIAVHYGCHMIRPGKSIHFDNSLHPLKYDSVIEALGAKSMDYPTKMLCCGGSLDRVDQHDSAIGLVEVKLKELKQIGADAITTTCPECFRAYDATQVLLKRKTGVSYNIPVITVMELIALSMGFEPEKIGLFEHKVDPSSFIKKFKKINGDISD